MKPTSGVAPWGFCSLQMKQAWVKEYPHFELLGSIKGWHQGWFYLKDTEGDGRLPAFVPDRPVLHANPEEWSRGPPSNRQRRLDDHRRGIAILMSRGLTGVGIMEAYSHRCVAPLMARPLHLFEMTEDGRSYSGERASWRWTTSPRRTRSGSGLWRSCPRSACRIPFRPRSPCSHMQR